jgi:predicted ABC-type exoprotein transport system permease subunit
MFEKQLLKQFLKRSIILFLLLGILCSFIFIWIIPHLYFSIIPIIFVYFFLLNIFTFRFLIKIQSLSTHKFTKQFMIFTFIKFFGSLIFAFLFLYFDPNHKIPFLVIFITLYFSTLIQGVHDFLKVLNQRNPK